MTNQTEMNGKNQRDESMPLVVGHGNTTEEEGTKMSMITMATTILRSPKAVLLLGLAATAAVSNTAWNRNQTSSSQVPGFLLESLDMTDSLTDKEEDNCLSSKGYCQSNFKFDKPPNPKNLDISNLNFQNGIQVIPELGRLEEVGILKRLVNHKKLEKVSRDSLEYFQMIHATTLDTAPNLSVAGGGLFGDEGYQTQGFGGLTSYDVYNVLKPITLVHADRRSRFHNTPGDKTLDDISYPEFGVTPKTRQAEYWSHLDKTKVLDLNTYQDKITQTCYEYDIITKCDFTNPTRLIVGTGAWRQTNDNSYCVAKNGKQWKNIYGQTFGPFANPQVADNSSFQWIVTVNVDKTTGKQIPSKFAPVTAIPGSCITCRINTEDVFSSWDNAENRDDCHKIYFPK